MHVRFYDNGMNVECVAIRTTRDGKDEVHRVATSEDRQRFKSEYSAFRNQPVVMSETSGVSALVPKATHTKPLKKRKE